MTCQSAYHTEPFFRASTHASFLASQEQLSQPSCLIRFCASEDKLSRLTTDLYVSDLSSALNWAELTKAHTAENIFLSIPASLLCKVHCT